MSRMKGLIFRNDYNLWFQSICVYLQVMDKEATLEQDMEKEVYRNKVLI